MSRLLERRRTSPNRKPRRSSAHRLRRDPTDAVAYRPRISVFGFRILFLILLPVWLTACRTAAPLARVDLTQPGWTLRQGQAVWRSRADAPEIAGEILVATANENRAFVQFSKTPFPIVVAQTTTNAWQLEFPTQNKRYSGHGSPPDRLIWFQLPRVLSPLPLTPNWVWHGSETNWRLENRSTGESLEGYFTP